MSRIGKLPVAIPGGVTVDYSEPVLKVKGPRGELTLDVHPAMTVHVGEGEVVVRRPSDGRTHRSLHGLTRALIANMVHGVTTGYSKTLEIVGVGYRAQKKGRELVLSLGFSHTIDYPEPEGITLECPRQDIVVVHGIDKQKVGQVAAEIRSFRPPEPYKGKGVRYQGEQIRRKVGKTAAS
ncbi:MAG: 50S ribosomal protein L6 [Gammaproteobacteria bacterium]|nr:50S ribosomal protein L6 [Gammaproteobacteria bacterium]MDE0257605.1 50S ribosomal protein L6 [Gammaproteobacteria bacterium]MDE0475934.1 50S ribosomal protein L6 [Gammaproteobacteria bacterium]MXY30195.1 50S ribosomal protein L6 [Gammaproteobacteria bacterium]MYD00301.1 50S ribosomal protein L6 [Gammaproteobacteria bacterium]